MRGNPQSRQAIVRQEGSIPACAGESCRSGDDDGRGKVYPRVCGGIPTAVICELSPIGLSPRVRGNRITAPQPVAEERSIPACAGESFVSAPGASAYAVYPRVCGGIPLLPPSRRRRQGLSPRVRGNRKRQPQTDEYTGSIPACAGESIVLQNRSVLSPVYPRVCGGIIARRTDACLYLGLSPRVRGNHVEFDAPHAVHGSIPACAGESAASSVAAATPAVYPRVCGGIPAEVWAGAGTRGLSPRVRGNPFQGQFTIGTPGSIPACAGESL